jgi:tetratricopeptide (TPR) repeat protein
MGKCLLRIGVAGCLVIAGAVAGEAADDAATCVSTTGDYAIAACTRAIDSGQYQGADLSGLYDNRGVEYSRKGQRDRAIADYGQAIRLNPNNTRALNNRGSAYSENGDHDRAIADYNEAIRIDPNYVSAYYNRGLAKRAKGDADGGNADIAKAMQLSPKSGR